MTRVIGYSNLAERDLENITIYTAREWGDAQAILYLVELEGWCERIAENPTLGRKCDSIRNGLRRIEQRSHVIFYNTNDTGILVVRILHKSMVPVLHEFVE